MIDVLLGLQFGDEGKGKIVDLITPTYQIVARFAGGCNAGHTLVFNGKKHVLHLIPSGIFHDCMNVIGNGCVIDPINLINEIKKLEEMGVDVKSKLLISDKVHITFPWHKNEDKLLEDKKGQNKIGSTLKGIGPTYTAKIARDGIRLGQLKRLTIDNLKEQFINKYGNDFDIEIFKEISNAISLLCSYQIINTEIYLNKSLKEGKNILAEGAQGSLLDIDFGTYPFVTSSNTCIGGVITGLGVPPQSIRNVIGITKAYATRVGYGPFTTEQDNSIGEFIQKEGNEFGSTTGRARRCGWLDLVSLKYTCMINGVTELNLMKLDVLSNLDEINICTQYDSEGKAIYQVFKGWKQNISKINIFDNLPENCKIYINFVQNFLNLKITRISVGADRKETINN